jgi:heavy metal sensor kinase
MGEGRGEGDPMKIFKSIKWRLQIWYGLILVVVLAGLGYSAYQLEYGKMYRRIDKALTLRLGALAKAFHESQEPDRLSFDRPPPAEFSDGGPAGQNQHPPIKFRLPTELAGWFDSNDPNNFYFIINSRDGGELTHSTNAPTAEISGDYPHIGNPDFPQTHPNMLREAIQVTTTGKFREMLQLLPPGEIIRVGCSITPELKELHRTAWKLAGIGAIILFFGLAVGWWFVSRALRPVENISAAAVKISAGDLSQRINVAEAESELGQLAAVLNSTFARLEAAFAQQKQFASDAAHELRTPVAVILTQTQIALNRERDAASYKETVEACQRAAQRMRKLIKSLLELARLDAGQEKLKRLQFDLSKIVEDCVELIRPLADGRNVKIISELEPLEISGDSERLAQVVTNLLTNAIQYNREGGEVRVKLKIKDGFAALKISDTGAGISAEDLPHVFKRFYRGDKSRTGASNSGLGLAISKAIVEAHGGTIEVASEENIGTTFIVRLPLG